MAKGYRIAPPKASKHPANAEDGAAAVRAALVKLFDRGDGAGADWKLMLESLYRAGFKIADDQLANDVRRSMMRRVHEGAEARLTGGYADGAGPSEQLGPGEENSPIAAMAGWKASTPKPH